MKRGAGIDLDAINLARREDLMRRSGRDLPPENDQQALVDDDRAARRERIRECMRRYWDAERRLQNLTTAPKGVTRSR